MIWDLVKPFLEQWLVGAVPVLFLLVGVLIIIGLSNVKIKPFERFVRILDAVLAVVFAFLIKGRRPRI